MMPYLTLLMIPSLFAMLNTRKLSRLLWSFCFIAFVLFIGTREEVGPDWTQYLRIHAMQELYGFWEVAFQAEPLSHALFWISQNAGYESYLSNIVAAIILVTGIFSFARGTAYPWLAVVAATPYLAIVMGMSGLRQAMAVGVMLFVLSRWDRVNFIKRLIYILMAAMFHTSALVNSIFLVTNLKVSAKHKIFLGSIILLVTYYLGSGVSVYAENMSRYQQRYLEGGGRSHESLGVFYHIAMCIVPVMVAFRFRRRVIHYIHNRPLFQFGLYASAFVFLLAFISSTVASRLSLYLFFLPMMIYPAFVDAFGRGARQMVMVTLVALHIILLVGWFSLGNVAFAYIPYRSILSPFE